MGPWRCGVGRRPLVNVARPGALGLRWAQSPPRLQVIEVTEPYVSMPGETATTPSRGVVLRVKV